MQKDKKDKKDKEEKPEREMSDFQKILKERELLDQRLQKEYLKEVTIFFSDICGYTAYMDKKGDVSGRIMLMQHNKIVLPEIEKHNGKIVEIIGDAVMASFATPLSAVNASIDIQRALYAYNSKKAADDRIYIRIGIHEGGVLHDESAHFQSITGDVANVASRIQSEAGRGEILISERVYEKISESRNILCRFYNTATFKGKSYPVKTYCVLWQERDDLVEGSGNISAREIISEKRGGGTPRICELEFTIQKDILKLSVHERVRGEENTVQYYEEFPFSIEKIKKKCHEAVAILNMADQKGSVSRRILGKLRKIGNALYDDLLSANVKERLKTTKAEYLSVKIDGHLVQVPWELLNDGQKFLCRRFHMGRIVKTHQPYLCEGKRELARPLKMLIIADPGNDLKGASSEGIRIKNFMDSDKSLINASFVSEDITPGYIKEKMRNFDLLHFAGHADYDPHNTGESGWRLSRGSFKAKDIKQMIGTCSMPSLIFSNTCQSARTEAWEVKTQCEDEILGLANSFLLAGVKHYVGTLWEISDVQSSLFALEFYKYLLSGVSIGEAISLSRAALIKESGEDNIAWAGYVLYGDPTFNYRRQIERNPAGDEAGHLSADTLEKKVETGEEEVIPIPPARKITKKGTGKKRWHVCFIMAVILFLAGVLLFGTQQFLKMKAREFREELLSYYHGGDFENAFDLCRILEKQNRGDPLCYLIRGDILLCKGDVDNAELAYRDALSCSEVKGSERAHALIGMGRIASIKKQTDKALSYYQQASLAAPGSPIGYVSQAFIHKRKGEYDEAFGLIQKALPLSPGDPLIRSLSGEIRNRRDFKIDQKKQERIDLLVQKLLEDMELPGSPVTSDTWTSRPLTIWIMDFNIEGYSLHEGEADLINAGLTEYLHMDSRIHIVERELFDKLLKELDIGRSKLVDKGSMLSIGRLLAARLILSGVCVYSGPRAQVFLRLIETETGEIVASINELFSCMTSVTLMTEKIAKGLSKKIDVLYPLRGRISDIADSWIWLNIGDATGAAVGQRFRLLDTELTLILEIDQLQKNKSRAIIIKGEKENIQEDMRVEAIS